VNGIRLLHVCTAVAITVVALAAASAPAADADPAAAAARLQAAVAELTARRTAADQRWAAAVAEKTAARDELAAALLATELQRRQLAAGQTVREQAVHTQVDEAARLRAAIASAESAADQLAEHLQVLAGELPAATVPGALAADNRPDDIAAAADAFLAVGMAVRQVDATIRVVDGRELNVDLLQVGHVGHLYAADGEAGAAFRSPTDADGVRWAAVAPTAAAAIEAAVSAGSSATAIPLDVTCSLQQPRTIGDARLVTRLRAGGAVMIPLLAIAITALLLMLERMVVLYRDGARRESVVAAVLAAADAGDWAGAEDACVRRPGVVPRTLAACLRARPGGAQAMEDAIQEQLLHEVPRLRRFLGGIGVLAAVAPLLGLLGTVTGIIRTFHVLTVYGDAHPGAMAGGITEALMTTAAGLTIAIPILLGHAWLNGRADSVVADAERHAATLLNLLVSRGRS
jgi:biopolymer transport protein ExbB